MVEHSWKIEEIDGGHLGVADFWTCPVCTAGGGPSWGDCDPAHPPAPGRAFLPGPAFKLPDDCEAAKKIATTYRETTKWFCGIQEKLHAIIQKEFQPMVVAVKASNSNVRAESESGFGTEWNIAGSSDVSFSVRRRQDIEAYVIYSGNVDSTISVHGGIVVQTPDTSEPLYKVEMVSSTSDLYEVTTKVARLVAAEYPCITGALGRK
jgi:hypothetical protein